MDTLNEQECGVIMNNKNYNVFTYADDLLLTSLTITGLQSLIMWLFHILKLMDLDLTPQNGLYDLGSKSVHISTEMDNR